MEQNNKERPFSQGYVLRTTAKHMRRSIDISIRKTFDRIAEFGENQEKSTEIFKTLAVLHSLRKQVDDFQLQYKQDFTGE